MTKLTRDGLRAYYVESDLGCGIRWSRSLASATAQFIGEVGTYNNPVVRQATVDDVDWVDTMGGKVEPD